MKRYAPIILATLVLAAGVYASAIKTWSTGETITSSALNTALSHIHTAAEATVTNASISGGAAISHSKLATPALVPKAWATSHTVCVGAGAADSVTCSLTAGSAVTSIKNNATTGQYRIRLSYQPSDTAYLVLVSPMTGSITCYPDQSTYTAAAVGSVHFVIKCFAADFTTAANAQFSFIVMD